jgi:hypothetical protein
MTNTAESKPKSRAEREAAQRAARRVEQAGIVSALKNVMESDEQLLGFARGRIAGGFRGKLVIGPEAFFAPIVNIGLTERRLILQHVHPENGRPSEMLPHFFPLSEIAALNFSDIETYGAEPACRLIVHMAGEVHCRLRLRGQLNFESAQTIAEVFTSLTGPRRSGSTPTQRTCGQCQRMLDQPYKFCPYCGQQQPESAVAETASSETASSETASSETASSETASSEPVSPEFPIPGSVPETETPHASADETEPYAEAIPIWPTHPIAADTTEVSAEPQGAEPAEQDARNQEYGDHAPQHSSDQESRDQESRDQGRNQGEF